jgi:hypothetical protein
MSRQFTVDPSLRSYGVNHSIEHMIELTRADGSSRIRVDPARIRNIGRDSFGRTVFTYHGQTIAVSEPAETLFQFRNLADA